MARTVSQIVFRPNPGADMMKLMDLVKESAAIWKKHGADVSLWSVSAGEIGNMVFTAVFVNKVVRFSKRPSPLFLAPSDAPAAGSATPL